MGVSTFVQPNFPIQSGTVYKTSIDDCIAVMKREAAAFAPHEQSTPDMTVRVDAGGIYSLISVTNVAAQNTGTITAPSVNPRIDRVSIHRITGVVSVTTGAEAASPVPPALDTTQVPIAQIDLVVSQTSILNVDITDERDLKLLGNVQGTHIRKNDDYTAVAADTGTFIEMDKATAVTLTLDSATSALNEGWFIFVHNSGVGVCTVAVTDSSDLIDDGSSITLVQGEGVYISCDGDEFWTIGRNPPDVVTTLANEATPTVVGVRLAKTGGTTTITDFDDGVVGQSFTLLSGHAVTITDGTNILLNGSANFVMAAGDTLTLTMFNDQVWEETARKVN